MKVAIVQTSPGIEAEANLATIESFIAEAAAGGAKLVVFPEESMLLADDAIKPDFPEILPGIWAAFEARISDLAREHNIAVIAAGYEPNGEDQPFNTILAFNAAGVELARYHKIHTYDAFAYKESSYITRGSELPPIIEVEDFRIGIANCYDVRFPELFRYLAGEGVDVISLSAAWVSGKGKEEHWTALTQSRAIENVSWMLASGTVDEDAVGLSRVIDPLGVVVASLNAHDEGIAFAEISRDRLDRARAMLPALDNRRISLNFDLK